jgi:molybdate transport system ATP-binding protein
MSLDVAFRHAFADLQLDIAFTAGEKGITALFGPSGVGKTTALNVIAGLFRPDGGRVSLDGDVLFDSARRLCVPPQRRRIGYVFQDGRLFPHLTVEKNLRFGWRRAEVRVPESEVDRVLDMLGLGKLLGRKPSQLSGGEKARVALGRALLSNPRLLLLDEPLSALDAARKDEILPYLERLHESASLPIIYVSHSLDEIIRLADTIVLLSNGGVAAAGPIFDVLNDLGLPQRIGGPSYGSVLDTGVERHIEAEQLSVLSFPGGQLLVPLLAKPPGARLRTHIRAENVIIAREEPRAISANNILRTVISDIREADPAHIDVRLLCGPTALIARITGASCARLGLARGQEVFAIVKSLRVVPKV